MLIHFPYFVARQDTWAEEAQFPTKTSSFLPSLDEKPKLERWPVIPDRGLSEELWWQDLGVMLSRMMQLAEYTPQEQEVYNGFFRSFVAPALGVHPMAATWGNPLYWKSFMGDDHTPVELSWSWKANSKESHPTTRYSVEPIGPHAGTALDPLNTHATLDFISKLHALLPQIDLGWFRFLLKELVVPDDISRSADFSLINDSNNPTSQLFLAFDLLVHDNMLKVYFMPELRAKLEGCSKLSLVESVINKLAVGEPKLGAAFGLVSDFLRSFDPLDRPEVEIVAIDCVKPAENRIKLYVRSNETSIDSVVNMMTLGGRLSHASSETALASLEELWRLIFSLDETKGKSEPLAPESERHRTAGVLYYFELKPGKAVPKSKVYMPVKHYAKSDLQVARGLSTYLSARNQGLSGAGYTESVQSLCKHRQLEQGRGFHSYISCAIEGKSLDVTSYLNPEVYHPSRWQG